MKKIISCLLVFALAFTLFLDLGPSAKAAKGLNYHAYMGIQTNTKLWVFRNAYDEPNYGYGTEAFDGLHYLDGQKLVDMAGTFTDVELTKDGTYTVALNNPDFSTETNLSQLFISTDIPYVEDIKVTNVIVKFDGKTVYTFKKGVLNPESLNYVQILCINIWNDDVKDLFPTEVFKSSCEITFTISGLDKAKAAADAVKGFSFKMYKDHAAFSGYTGSKTSITIPKEAYGKKVTEIADNALLKSSVKSVKIPDTVTKIGKYAFAGSKLTSFTVPKAVTSIGDGAFSSCKSIKKLAVAKGNTSFAVKDGVLYSKDMKTLVQYPAGKTGSSFTVPKTVTSIQGGAFAGCTSLTKVTISKDVTKIGKDAFKDCSSKLTIYAPSGSAAYTFAQKNKIKVKKN